MKIFVLCACIAISVVTAQTQSNVLSNVKPVFETAQIESTITLLEDSVRLQSFIRDLRLLNDSKKITDANTVVPDSDSTTYNSLSFSVLSIWERLQHSGKLMFGEIMGYERLLLHIRTLVLPDTLVALVIMIILIMVSIFAGFISHLLFSRLSKRLLNMAEQGGAKLTGRLFLFTRRFSSSAALVATLCCYGLLAGKSDFGIFVLHCGYAILLHGVMAAMVRVFFSKKYPDYRIYNGNSKKNNHYFIISMRVLTFCLISWFVYESAVLMNLDVTSSIISGMFKIGFTMMFTSFMYHFRDIFKTVIPVVNQLHALIRISVTVLSFVINHLYIISFIFLSALTITSFSVDQSLYQYLLKSIVQTVITVVLIAVLCFVLRMLVEHTKRYIESGTSDTYYKQLLIKNRTLIVQGGYAAISLLGVYLLVNTWGVNVYRILNSDIPFVSMIVHILAIGIFSFLVMQLTNLLIQGFQRETLKKMTHDSGSNIEIQKRVDTLGNVFRKIVGAAIITVAIIMIIEELGFDIKAMLAGVGIVGLAVGFGAQNLVRDIISGLFLIFDNRIRVGDVAIVNGTGGLVEQVNLRTIVLRGFDGTIHVFSNGAITSLSNMTHEFSCYVFDVGVAYKENIDHVITVLGRVGESMLADKEYRDVILEPLEIVGVDKFGPSQVIIKARIKTLPIKQWMVGREMNKRIKNEFDKEGIEIPFPHQSIYFGKESEPFTVKIEGSQSFIQPEKIKSVS